MKLHERIIISEISAVTSTFGIECPVCKQRMLYIRPDEEADGAFQGTWTGFCENEKCKSSFSGEIKTVELVRVS